MALLKDEPREVRREIDIVSSEEEPEEEMDDEKVRNKRRMLAETAV